MRRFLLPLSLGAVLLLPAALQAQDGMGFSVDCDNGASFSNGIEIIVNQMRSGFTYEATAIGLDGFDPVLAVVGEDGDGLCSDDERAARNYDADLPTTGYVRSSNLSSQVSFDTTGNAAFQDVSLVVGGYGDQTGEVVVVLEGMAVTSEDNAGDPFSVNITPEMVGSGVPLSVYMLTRGTSGVDPLIYMTDADFNVLQDTDGNDIYCDDAGTNSCWGESVDLSPYSVSIDTGTLPGWQYDAMLVTGLEDLELSSDRFDNYLTYAMTSFEGRSEGQYLLVFHFGIGGAVETDKGGNA